MFVAHTVYWRSVLSLKRISWSGRDLNSLSRHLLRWWRGRNSRPSLGTVCLPVQNCISLG